MEDLKMLYQTKWLYTIHRWKTTTRTNLIPTIIQPWLIIMEKGVSSKILKKFKIKIIVCALEQMKIQELMGKIKRFNRIFRGQDY